MLLLVVVNERERARSRRSAVVDGMLVVLGVLRKDGEGVSDFPCWSCRGHF